MSLVAPRSLLLTDTNMVGFLLITLSLAFLILNLSYKKIDPYFNIGHAVLFLWIGGISSTSLFGIEFYWGILIIAFLSYVIINLIIKKTQPEIINNTKVFKINWQVLTLFSTTVLLLVHGSVQVHYDYYHGLIPSVDLALNNKSPSSWLREFDPTFWPIKTQTIMPVLDAIELRYGSNKSIYGGASLIFVFIMMALITNGMMVNGAAMIAVVLCFLVYLVDFSMTPRPHLIVGLSLCLLLQSASRPLFLILSLSILVLSKRDGLILIIIFAAIFFALKVFSGNSIREKIKKINIAQFSVFGVLITFALHYFLMWIPLKEFSMWEMIQGLFNNPSFSFLGSSSVLLSILLLVLCLFYLYVRNGDLNEYVVILGIFIHIFISSMVLENFSQFNEGTIERKLIYIMLPTVLLIASRRRV